MSEIAEPKWLWLEGFRSGPFHYDQYLLIINNRLFLMFKTDTHWTSQIWKGIELEGEEKEQFFKGGMMYRSTANFNKSKWSIKVVFNYNGSTLYKSIQQPIARDIYDKVDVVWNIPQNFKVELKKMKKKVKEAFINSSDYESILDTHYKNKTLENSHVYFHIMSHQKKRSNSGQERRSNSDGYHGEGTYRNQYGVEVFYND